MKTPSSAPLRSASWVARVIPSVHLPALQLQSMQAIIQAVVQEQQVVAFELAKTAQGTCFLLRTTDEAALQRVMQQVQARYPQAQVEPLAPQDDPLHGTPDDQIQGIVLQPTHAAYQSLHTWSQKELQTPGTDPLVGLLAAFERLPPEMQVVSQLLLTPAPREWTRPYQQLALRHPLEEQRQQRIEQQRHQRGKSAPSWGPIVALGVLVAGLLAARLLPLTHLVPSWMQQAGTAMLQTHQLPALTAWQSQQLVLLVLVGSGAILLPLFLLRLLIIWLRPAASMLDDRERIAAKLRSATYRAQLSLFVIQKPFAFRAALSQREPGHLHTAHTRIPRHFIRLLSQLQAFWQRRQERHLRRVQGALLLDRLIQAYGPYHTTDAGFRARTLSPRQVTRWLRTPLAEQQQHWQRTVERSQLYLSGEEVSLLWHLPQGLELRELPSVEQRLERTLPLPQELLHARGWHFGTCEHAGQTLPFTFPETELHRHKFVIGRTGKGKSTLFHHLALAYLQTYPTHGLCILEPHGDLVDALLALVPPERSAQVVLLDLAHRERPPGVNPLDMRERSETDILVSSLLTTLKAIWKESWGSRIENIMRFSLKTLAEANRTILAENGEEGPFQQYTLLDLVPLLTRQSVRRQILQQVGDPHIVAWWQTFYGQLDASLLSEIITPVLTKISTYASSPILRRILGQPASTFNFAQLIRDGGILLVNTASGSIGRDMSSLLGATITGLFSAALSEQLTLQVEQRRQFLFLIDEFRNYPVDYGFLLSEQRKAGQAMVLAAQSLAQLDLFDPALRPTVLANVDHLFAFTMANEDAKLLSHELGGIEPHDLVNLPDYTCFTRLSLHGKRLPSFSFRLALPPTGDPLQEEELREQSTKSYGRPAAQIDQQLTILAQRFQSVKKTQEQTIPTLETPEEQPPATPRLRTRKAAPQQKPEEHRQSS